MAPRSGSHRRRVLNVGLIAIAALMAALHSSEAHAQRAAITRGNTAYSTWQDYYTSNYFEENGKRCGKPASVIPRVVDPSDCSFTFTNPSSDYDTVDIFDIPVVVHIIEHTNGDGQISDALVHSQIDVLNEDFQALAGTPGAPGFDVGINFVLATTDPMGNPTTGITRSVNNTWFNDNGGYWNTLAWDTNKYMNVYTNSADGNLGYVPELPQGGAAGSDADRVVVLWSAFGRNSSGGPPYDQGRTLTHEVGHYLGLEHTFSGGCGTTSAPGCYTSGDLICDTNGENSETSGCPGGKSSCGSPDPIENYMDYSFDTCMDMFTDEQSHRMRCSLLNYRPDLYSLAAECGNDVIEIGEGCDDGDVIDGDGCSSTCAIEACHSCTGEPSTCSPLPDTTACDDQSECTGGDSCQSAVCIGTPVADGTSCDDGQPCTVDTCLSGACDSSTAPQSGCLTGTQAGKGLLLLKDKANNKSDKLIWKLLKAEATTLADFANPTSGTEFELCVYDKTGGTDTIIMAMEIPGGPKWDAKPTGFKYKDNSGADDGVKTILLKEGIAGKAKIIAKAKGPELPIADLGALVLPLTVQLRNGTKCWESTFDTNVLRSDADFFKAKPE